MFVKLFQNYILNEFKRNRGIHNIDNYKIIDAWVKEYNTSLESYNYSLLTNRVGHFIAFQNGDIQSDNFSRNRNGLWFGLDGLMRYIKFSVNNKPLSDEICKYVRRPEYIYREYTTTERMDYMPLNKKILDIVFNPKSKLNFTVEFNLIQTKAWPSQLNICPNVEIKNNDIHVSGKVINYFISLENTDNVNLNYKDGILKISFTASSFFKINIHAEDEKEALNDFTNISSYYENINNISKLSSSSFELDKAFYWAKHDLSQFYFEINEDLKGFYAGFPCFSWIFGRDSCWISIATSYIGMWDETQNNLNTLLKHSINGRIPHELALTDHKQNYEVSGIDVDTKYMSIDSTPMWVIANNTYSHMSGDKSMNDNLKKMLEFMKSCDIDGDGFVENDFSRGLIGWPETWAKDRDGKCIEINAWFMEMERIISGKNKIGRYQIEKFMRSFYKNEDTFIDSIYGDSCRIIKSPLLCIPGIYFKAEENKKILENLSEDESMTPWGIRSMSINDSMYDGSYHKGTVWPLMTGWYGLSCFNNGLNDLGQNSIYTFIKNAFSSRDLGRINETYNPNAYSESGQFAQGWSISLFIQLIFEGILGFRDMDVDNIKKSIYGAHNRIKGMVDHMEITDIKMGKSFVSIYIDGEGEKISIK